MTSQGAGLKPDEAQRQKDLKIDTIRAWQADINLRPYEGRRRVFILHDAERLTEAASDEVRQQGVNVNALLPSLIDTPRNRADMPNADYSKWVSPEALADVVCFLLSDAAKAVHGALIPVRGLV